MAKRSAYTQGRFLVKRSQGPFAKLFSCPFCSFHVRVMKKGPEAVGNILVHSGAATAKVASHIAHEHADRLD